MVAFAIRRSYTVRYCERQYHCHSNGDFARLSLSPAKAARNP